MKSHEAMELMIPLRGGHVDAHAKALQRSTSLVKQWRRPSSDDLLDTGKVNPIDRMITIMRTASERGLPENEALAGLHCQAQEFNGVFVRLPSPYANLEDQTKDVLAAMKEIGEWSAKTSESLEDGKLSDREREAILKEGYEAIAGIMASLQHCKKEGE